MKKALTGAFLLFLFIGTTSIASAQGVKYASIEGKMTVVFPEGSETSTSETIDDGLTSVKTQGQYKNLLFYVSFTDHKVDLIDQESLEQVSVDSFVGAMNGTVSEQSTWKVGKEKGIRVEFVLPEMELIGEYCVVIVGQIQYQITVVGASSDWDQSAVDKFFKSLKVKK